jgi:hypothetical protein
LCGKRMEKSLCTFEIPQQKTEVELPKLQLKS